MSGDHVHFDFHGLSGRQRYKLMIGAIVPRPIAFVTTVDDRGVVNAAPFSFFNCLSADPPIVALGVEYREGRNSKDTGRNIRLTGEFTVNIVSDTILEAMNVGAIPFDAGVDEIALAGLTAIAGTQVKCPRIAESPASFECRRTVALDISHSREIVLGEVVGLHLRADTVDLTNFHVDPVRLDAIGRMGGHGYVRTHETFTLPTMTVADWENRRLSVRSAGSAAAGRAPNGGG